MLSLHRGVLEAVARPVIVGLVVFSALLRVPLPAACQEREADTAAPGAVAHLGFALRGHGSDPGGRLVGPDGRPPSIQDASAPRRHTVIGLATGITVASVALPLSLGASTCFGSGNYLELCRIAFLGATVVGGGMGALVGRGVKSDGPPGRATHIMVGSALGAVGAFLVSLPVCEQEKADNPDLICGYDGMIEPGTVLGAAVAGGMLGYLLRGRSESLAVSGFGPVPTLAGRSAWAVAFSLRNRR